MSDDDDDDDEEEEDELAKVAGKTAGDWMTLATPDYRGEFWKRKTERDLWVVFGKQYPIELEETLTNFTFAIPRIIDPDTMRPILRKWRMAYALDTTVGVTKYYLPKPRFVAISIRKATRFTSLLLRSCLAAAFVRLVLAYVA